ncbi:MAG: polysaccharide biosynthesis/export family protein [Ferruginibacter sp.]|nr:polysaccharide biosynthesis/export family protein [Ferruginibacter sp.]
MRLIIIVLAYLALAFSSLSCKTVKPNGYFQTLQRDTTIQGFVNPGLDSKIITGDQLAISINSLSVDENMKFNNTNITETQGQVSTPGYPVDEGGNIKIHRLGVVHVAGLTRRELASKLEKDLLPYLREPLVSVTFLNHKVTVMGGVANPQVISLSGDNMPIFEAIVKAGDVGKEGRLDHVLIIRDSSDKKIVKKVNLEDHSIFASNWYFLQPDDIVYVMPDYLREEREERRRKLQGTLSLVVSAVSLVVVVLTRIIK